MMDGHSFDNLTDEELEALCDAAIRESNRRETAKRTLFIENFRDAWRKMREAKIRVKYYESDDDDYGVWLDNWEGFDFD